LRFEWDDAKAISNVEKHGITFGEATEVFYDPNALEGHDTEHSGDEDRFFIIGNMIRTISARKPTPTERDLYEKGER
jgi:uncharacterized DUF497 family protein